MYKFNHQLIEKLPGILGIGKKQFAKDAGVTYATYLLWVEGDISCEHLVRICNRFHISISSFITLGDGPLPPEKAGSCILPAETWKDIEWRNGTFATLFGRDGSLTGITKKEAAARLGFSAANIYDYWSSNPGSARMEPLIRMLNEFHLDASLFFHDPNGVVPLPAWGSDCRHIAEIIDERMNGYRELEKKFSDKVQEVNALRLEKERINREKQLMHQKMADRREGGTKAKVVYETLQWPSLFSEKGYRFHHGLWSSLHGMLDLTRKEFCQAVGVPYAHLNEESNVPVTSVVTACNLYRISISHFFVPKSEVAVVHDLAYYRMSSRIFKPVEDCMDRMELLFGEYSATGVPVSKVEKMKVISRGALIAGSRKDGSMRVNTLCNICTQFNISPHVFFNDENRKTAAYFPSSNERLVLNAIGLVRTINRLKDKIKVLEERLANQ